MVINWEKAKNITGGDPILYRDLWNMILESMEEKTDAIWETLKKQDWSAVEFAVHKLKGALRNVAAEDACAFLQEMEDGAKAGQGEIVQERIDQMDGLITQVVELYQKTDLKKKFEES